MKLNTRDPDQKLGKRGGRRHLRFREYNPGLSKITLCPVPSGICMVCSAVTNKCHHRLCRNHFPRDGQTHLLCTCGGQYTAANGGIEAIKSIHRNISIDFKEGAKPQLFIRISACVNCDAAQKIENVRLDVYTIRP